MDRPERLKVLALVRQLDLGWRDGQESASPDEPPQRDQAGDLKVEIEPYLGDASLTDQRATSPADPCVHELAEEVLPLLENIPSLDLWRQNLGPQMTLPQLFEAINAEASDFLSVEELDEIGARLADRPIFALPEYFRPLVHHHAARRMLVNISGALA